MPQGRWTFAVHENGDPSMRVIGAVLFNGDDIVAFVSNFDYRDTNMNGEISWGESFFGSVGFNRSIFVSTAIKELTGAIADPNAPTFDYNQIQNIRYSNMLQGALAVGTEVLQDAVVSTLLGQFTGPLLEEIIGRFTSDTIPQIILTNLGELWLDGLTDLPVGTAPPDVSYAGYDVRYAGNSSAQDQFINPDNGSSPSGSPQVILTIASNRSIDATAGSDVIISDWGSNQLSGFGGDDHFYLTNANVVPYYSGAHAVIDGGNGDDTLTLRIVPYATADAGIRITGMIAGTGQFFDASSNFESVEAYSRYEGSDKLIVTWYIRSYSTYTPLNDVSVSGIEHLELHGSDYEDDLLVLGTGTGAAYGNGYFDTLYADWSEQTTAIHWDLNLENDTAKTLENGVTIQGVERLYLRLGNGDDYLSLSTTGMVINNNLRVGSDVIFGGGGNDTILGGAGNDRISGGSGTNMLYGGAGNDTYYVDSVSDLIFEDRGQGNNDTVIASVDFYLPANVESLRLAGGAGDIFGVGNEFNNIIYGNESANLLIAGAGDDAVYGGAARDAIFGEDGADYLNGDAGIDYIVGGNGDDVIDGGADADEIYGQEGDDTITGGASFDTDIIVGGDGNDTIHGNSGAGDFDFLYGNLGDDTFYVDTPADLVFEQSGEGTDTVYAGINGGGFYLYDNIENLILTDNTPFGVGNGLDNSLTGNAISNYLLGGLGNDTLNGMGGNDVLFGEGGNDTFVFTAGTGGDVIGDFTRGQDKIDISAFGFSFAQAQANFIQNGNVGAINLGNGDFIVLHNVTMSTLTAADFIFAAVAEPAPKSGPPVMETLGDWGGGGRAALFVDAIQFGSDDLHWYRPQAEALI